MGLARPTPYSWSVGDDFTAAIGNNTRDALLWSQNPPSFVGTQSTVQSIPNTSWTPLGLDTFQIDSYTGHSNSTNNSRWTCPTGGAGWYLGCGCSAYVPNATGFRTARLQINGTAVPGAEAYLPNNGGAESVVTTPTRLIFLNVGDYVEVAAWQNSGGAINTSTGGETRSALFLGFYHA